jgi:hypothetical protein
MDPTPLLMDVGPDLPRRLPEAERTIAGGELGIDDEAILVAQPNQQLVPRLLALTEAVVERQELLLAAGAKWMRLSGCSASQSALAKADRSDLNKICSISDATNSKPNRLAAMTTALIRLCRRLSNRILIFGLVCFAVGVWVGRLTAHKPVLWGLLGS